MLFQIFVPLLGLYFEAAVSNASRLCNYITVRVAWVQKEYVKQFTLNLVHGSQDATEWMHSSHKVIFNSFRIGRTPTFKIAAFIAKTVQLEYTTDRKYWLSYTKQNKRIGRIFNLKLLFAMSCFQIRKRKNKKKKNSNGICTTCIIPVIIFQI